MEIARYHKCFPTADESSRALALLGKQFQTLGLAEEADGFWSVAEHRMAIECYAGIAAGVSPFAVVSVYMLIEGEMVSAVSVVVSAQDSARRALQEQVFAPCGFVQTPPLLYGCLPERERDSFGVDLVHPRRLNIFMLGRH
jgi:hypothetical protein